MTDLHHQRRRPIAALALLLAAMGCAGRDGGPRVTAPAPPPGFTADTFTREGLVSGAIATEAGCQALADGLWVRAGDGRGECLRYVVVGAGQGPASRRALVYVPGDAAGVAYRFAGGRRQIDGAGEAYEVPAETRRAAAAALSGSMGGSPVVLIGRPGMHGSSGDHARDRHGWAEVELVDAALTDLRRRHGFQEFVLSGYSSGGAIVANLLARRTDIRCAVLASAPLHLAAFYHDWDGRLPDHYALRRGELADPMLTVHAIRGDAAIFVLGDRRDRKVPAQAWDAWVAAARQAGLPVFATEISGFDPAEPGGANSYHRTAARALQVARACATGEPPPLPQAPPPGPGAENGGGARLADRVLRAIE